jgi:hypothetical protein
MRLSFTNNLLFLVGSYGSGKTEIAVNLALTLRREGAEVTIADLDLVNPYFRCREPKALMTSAGIRVVVPPGARQYADLPTVMPEIKGMMEVPRQAKRFSIFDVGGDDVGATVLASFHESLVERPYTLLQVINSKRPFTDSVAGCLAMRRDIERTARLKVTHLVVNAHLMEETTPEVIEEGWALASAVSAASGIPIAFVAVARRLVHVLDLDSIDAPVLPLHRIMVPPWLRPEVASSGTRAADTPGASVLDDRIS